MKKRTRVKMLSTMCWSFASSSSNFFDFFTFNQNSSGRMEMPWTKTVKRITHKHVVINIWRAGKCSDGCVEITRPKAIAPRNPP